MNDITNIFLVSISLLMVVVLYLALIIGDKKFGRFTVLIPFVLALCISTFFTIDKIKSLPIEGMPEGEFLMVHHVTDGKTIFLWAVDEGQDFPKTYKFPYTDEDARKLAEGQERNQKGVATVMRKGSQKEGGSIVILGSPKSKLQDNTNRKEYES